MPDARMTRRDLIGLGAATACASLLLEQRAHAEPLTREEQVQIDAVRAFAAGWKAHDADAVVAPFSDDCVIRWTAERSDTAAPPFRGKPAFLQRVQKALADQTIDMSITDIFALGPLVVNCHHQLFDSTVTGAKEDLYLGIYYFENGRIREWNDYAVFTPRARTAHAAGFDRFSRVAPTPRRAPR